MTATQLDSLQLSNRVHSIGIGGSEEGGGVGDKGWRQYALFVDSLTAQFCRSSSPHSKLPASADLLRRLEASFVQFHAQGSEKKVWPGINESLVPFADASPHLTSMSLNEEISRVMAAHLEEHYPLAEIHEDLGKNNNTAWSLKEAADRLMSQAAEIERKKAVKKTVKKKKIVEKKEEEEEEEELEETDDKEEKVIDRLRTRALELYSQGIRLVKPTHQDDDDGGKNGDIDYSKKEEENSQNFVDLEVALFVRRAMAFLLAGAPDQAMLDTEELMRLIVRTRKLSGSRGQTELIQNCLNAEPLLLRMAATAKAYFEVVSKTEDEEMEEEDEEEGEKGKEKHKEPNSVKPVPAVPYSNSSDRLLKVINFLRENAGFASVGNVITDEKLLRNQGQISLLQRAIHQLEAIYERLLMTEKNSKLKPDQQQQQQQQQERQSLPLSSETVLQPPHPTLSGASALIEVKRNEEKGRHVLAAEDISAGSVLFSERPFATYTADPALHCFNCFRRLGEPINGDGDDDGEEEAEDFLKSDDEQLPPGQFGDSLANNSNNNNNHDDDREMATAAERMHISEEGNGGDHHQATLPSSRPTVRYHSFVPCPTCNRAIFCTDACRQKALDRFHAAECSSGLVVLEAHLGIAYLALRTVLSAPGGIVGALHQYRQYLAGATGQPLKDGFRQQQQQQSKVLPKAKTSADTETEQEKGSKAAAYQSVLSLQTHAAEHDPQTSLAHHLTVVFLERALHWFAPEQWAAVNGRPLLIVDGHNLLPHLLLHHLQQLSTNAVTIFEQKGRRRGQQNSSKGLTVFGLGGDLTGIGGLGAGMNSSSALMGNALFRDNAATSLYPIEVERPIGVGLYPTIALLNHSCDPDVAPLYSGSRLTLQATRDRRRGDEVAFSYGPTYRSMPYLSRQKALSEQYFFRCRCSACLRRLENYGQALLCATCHGPAFLVVANSSSSSSSSLICSRDPDHITIEPKDTLETFFSSVVRGELAVDLQLHLASGRSFLAAFSKRHESEDAVAALLATHKADLIASNRLFPLNHLLVAAKTQMMECYQAMGHHDRTAAYARQLITAFSRYFSPNDPHGGGDDQQLEVPLLKQRLFLLLTLWKQVEEWEEDSEEICSKSSSSSSSSSAAAAETLKSLQELAQQTTEALDALEQALTDYYRRHVFVGTNGCNKRELDLEAAKKGPFAEVRQVVLTRREQLQQLLQRYLEK